jgi:hypothetical protein
MCDFYILPNPSRMPKQNNKSKGKGKAKGTKVEVAIAGADDDFDNMLAELRAADVNAEGTISASQSTSGSNSSSSTSTSSSSTSTRTPVQVSGDAVVQACIRGDIVQLRRWARRGFRVTSTEPLCNAVVESNYEVVKCMVRELGADVNQANEKGVTAVLIASVNGNLKMVKLLATELGADVDHTDAKGHTPLNLAAWHGNLAVMRCLVMELHANVDRGDNKGWTPLHSVAEQGGLDAVQCLVEELGADVNLAAQDGGATPLMIAALKMNHNIVRYLLKHGVDPQKTFPGNVVTAAHISANAGAPSEETACLEARTHCANPSCTNAGLKKCERCLQAYFCGSACTLAGT